ncbi:MAG: hypothetical protein JNL43_05320 [Flavobacteriales bacterium]|nr:hypothetical protein [Flavobacteriales bacterium]
MALIKTLELSCQKASALVERRDLKPLSGIERVGLWMHLRICGACRAYVRQSETIDRLLEERPQAGIDSTALEHRIISELR